MKTTLPVVLAAVSAGTLLASPAAPNYRLHEWGTFTTVSSSTGELLPGVYKEEEALPPFVHAHEGMHNHGVPSGLFTKGIDWRRPLLGVTVRMETPVLYFYTPEAFQARVEVGFTGGTISQWYPERSGGEKLPPIKRDAKGNVLQKENTLDFTSHWNGSITWDVSVTPPGPDASARVFRGTETPTWLHPRQPDSALVTTANGETEKYLFYRGLGRFDLPVTFASGDSSVTVHNRGESPVTGMLLYEKAGPTARLTAVSALAKGEKREISPAGNGFTQDWRKPVYAAAADMLTAAGLTRQEADAMVQTWWTSYFERDGRRVFWIVPRETTDRVLPLRVNPAPAETVRVLVGRSELLTPAFEHQLATEWTAHQAEERPNVYSSDRFFFAYDARVKQLQGARSAGR